MSEHLTMHRPYQAIKQLEKQYQAALHFRKVAEEHLSDNPFNQEIKQKMDANILYLSQIIEKANKN